MFLTTLFLDIIANDEIIDRVSADELGKYWNIFEIIVILICVIPWLCLIIYLLFFKKYIVNFYIDNQLVHQAKYRKNQLVTPYQYENISEWYIDEECTIVYEFLRSTNTNLKLYAKIKNNE